MLFVKMGMNERILGSEVMEEEVMRWSVSLTPKIGRSGYVLGATE